MVGQDPERSEQVPQDGHESIDPLSVFDVDALTALTEFEVEHRRILAMQSLYYRRHGRSGIA